MRKQQEMNVVGKRDSLCAGQVKVVKGQNSHRCPLFQSRGYAVRAGRLSTALWSAEANDHLSA